MMILSSALVVGCFGAADPHAQPGGGVPLQHMYQYMGSSWGNPQGAPPPKGAPPAPERHLLGSGKNVVNDMVRFGAALYLTRGATNDWDINAKVKDGWKHPRYNAINANENIRTLHDVGSTFVHNYMDQGKETTCLLNKARMSQLEFDEVLREMVSKSYDWIKRTITLEFCYAQGYPDAEAVFQHWNKYVAAYDCILPSYGKSAPPLLKRLSMRINPSASKGFGSMREARAAMRNPDAALSLPEHPESMKQGEHFGLQVTDDEKIKYGRLAVITYLSRGLTDYFDNDKSILHKFSSQIHGQAKDVVGMIKKTGNLVAHKRSQNGIDLDEYSYWICHFEDKLDKIIESDKVTKRFETFSYTVTNGMVNTTNPFQERLEFVRRLKGDPELEPLWPLVKPGKVGDERWLVMDDFTSRRGGAVFEDPNMGVSYRQSKNLWKFETGKKKRS